MANSSARATGQQSAATLIGITAANPDRELARRRRCRNQGASHWFYRWNGGCLMKIALIGTSIAVLVVAVVAANVLPSRHEASYPKPYEITRR